MRWSDVRKGTWVKLRGNHRVDGDLLPRGTRLKVIKAPQHPLDISFVGRVKGGDKEYRILIIHIDPA